MVQKSRAISESLSLNPARPKYQRVDNLGINHTEMAFTSSGAQMRSVKSYRSVNWL